MRRDIVYKRFFTLALFAMSSSLYAGEAKWDDHYGSADEACKAKTEDSNSAFQYSHVEVQGDIGRCYVKPKDSENKSAPEYATVVSRTEKPEPEKPAQDTQAAGSSGSGTSKPAEQKSAKKKINICKELTKAFKETLKDELPPSKTGGATIAVGAIVSDDSIQSWVAGASSIIGTDGNVTVTKVGKPSTSKYDYYAEGVRLNQPSNVRACGSGQQFVYPNNPARPLQGHAESKIIEDWFKNGAANNTILYLKIGGAQTLPCTNCANLIQFVNNGDADCPKVKVCP